MTTSDYNADFMPEIQYKPSQLDRIEQRLDAIAELLAVLLDSVQQEEQEEESQDLDGVHIPSGGNAGGTL